MMELVLNPELNAAALSSTISRPLANFHPNIWGNRFLNYTPETKGVTIIIYILLYFLFIDRNFY